MDGTERVTKAVIPAAGRGTRFLPLTKVVPKELAPIVSTPTIEFVVAEAAGNGLSDLLVVLGPGKDEIADYFAPHPDLVCVHHAASVDRRSDNVGCEPRAT